MKPLLAFVVVLFAGAAVAQDEFHFVTQPDGLNYSRLDDATGPWSANDVVFIGDGFLESQMSLFDAAVKNCLYDSPEVGDGLLGIDPYQSSACRFRFWGVQLVSNESGIDDPQASTYRDTPLDCTFGSASEPYMKISGDAAKCVAAAEAAGVPAWDYIVVITNTPDRYGAYFPSGGRIVYLSSGNAWGVFLAHELGHAIAGLGDEYECETCNPAAPDYGRTIPPNVTLDEPNLTMDLNDIKWKDLIDDWVLDYGFIPTVPEHMCDCDVVGAWEGGGTYTYGVYRSQEYCAMDEFMCGFGDDFCAACRRAIDAALMPCGFFGGILADFRQLKTLIWELPPCFACDPPTSELAEESRKALEMDAIVMKLLHRGPPPWVGPWPERPRFTVYDDWSEPLPVRTTFGEDGIELSFTASRIRRYTIVVETYGDFGLDVQLDVELYRNGVRDDSFGR